MQDYMREIFSCVEEFNRKECLQVGKAIQDRLAEIRRADPYAYIVRRTLKNGKIRYMTEQPMGGWRQTVAEELNYFLLRVFANRSVAQDVADQLQGEKDRADLGEKYEVVAIEKKEFKNFVCWPRLKGRAHFQTDKKGK